MGKGGSDIANKVGEFEANTNLSQSQELYSAQKSLLSQTSSKLERACQMVCQTSVNNTLGERNG
jgi:hypothetical protein